MNNKKLPFKKHNNMHNLGFHFVPIQTLDGVTYFKFLPRDHFLAAVPFIRTVNTY